MRVALLTETKGSRQIVYAILAARIRFAGVRENAPPHRSRDWNHPIKSAPAAMTSLPSLGATNVFRSARKPPLPTEFTTTTPRAAAIVAARVVTAVSPFM